MCWGYKLLKIIKKQKWLVYIEYDAIMLLWPKLRSYRSNLNANKIFNMG